MAVHSGPHAFRPLRFWDRWRSDGRCVHCLMPRIFHPVAWVPARAMGDKRRVRPKGAAPTASSASE